MSDLNHNHTSGFSLPEDYFSNSAKALQNRMEWLEEHKAFPALKMAWRKSVFEIPQGYFEKASVTTELLPYRQLQSQQGKFTFVQPNELDLNIASIRLEKYKSHTTLEVPTHYFENNKVKLMALQTPGVEAKVISLRLRRFSFAAAAALLISSGWWAFSYFNRPEQPADCGGIACVDRNEVLQVKNLELLDDDQLLDVVNASALEKALQKNETKTSTSDSVDADDELLDAL